MKTTLFQVKEAEESDESGVDEEETAAQQQTETQKQGASEADLNFLLAVMKQTTEITGITPGITPPRSKVINPLKTLLTFKSYVHSVSSNFGHSMYKENFDNFDINI